MYELCIRLRTITEYDWLKGNRDGFSESRLKLLHKSVWRKKEKAGKFL